MTDVTFEITELHSATVGKIVHEVEVELKELRLLFLYGFETAVTYIGRDDIGFVMEEGREGAELIMEEVEEIVLHHESLVVRIERVEERLVPVSRIRRVVLEVIPEQRHFVAA